VEFPNPRMVSGSRLGIPEIVCFIIAVGIANFALWSFSYLEEPPTSKLDEMFVGYGALIGGYILTFLIWSKLAKRKPKSSDP